MSGCEEALNDAVREIAENMTDVGNITVVSAGEIPVVEYKGNSSGLLKFSHKALKTKLTNRPSFDLAVRLATNELINASPKRSIVYLTQGKLDDNAFSKYGLSDVTNFMSNNGVSFFVVQLEQNAIEQELDYIVKNLNGKTYYVYRPEGLSCIVQDMLDVPNGLYSFSYKSLLPTDLGRAYLPVEIETYLLNRSGRDETGYFSPLQ